MSEEDKKKQLEEFQKVAQGYMKAYTEIAAKMTQVSRIRARMFLGVRQENDPRLLYLVELETLVQVTVAQTEALATCVSMLLGPGSTEYMLAAQETMTKALERMQNVLGITAWDESGDPIFDLAKYKEVTQNWPR